VRKNQEDLPERENGIISQSFAQGRYDKIEGKEDAKTQEEKGDD
jgi:hypothetical protein